MHSRLLTRRAAAVVAALAWSAACTLDFVPRAEAREEWKKSYPVSGNAELAIENTNGKITVRPGTGSTIEVTAVRIAKAGDDATAKKVLAERKIEETVSGSSVKLSSRITGMNWRHTQYQVDYEVRAPAGITLSLSATNGTIDVSEWDGRVDMSATNGTLTGARLKGEVEASTTNGKIDLRLASLNERGVTVETTNGTVRVELPKDTKGRVLARVTNGGISVEGLNVEPSPANNRRRYEAAINGGGGGTVSVEATNGSITVRGS